MWRWVQDQEGESGSSYLLEDSVLLLQLLGALLQLCKCVLQLADLQQTGREDLFGHQVQIFRGGAFLALGTHAPAVQQGLDALACRAGRTPPASTTWAEATGAEVSWQSRQRPLQLFRDSVAV